MSVQEIDEVIAALGIYRGKRLQTVVHTESDLILGFWHLRLLWLWLDLHPVRPMLLPMVDLPTELPAKQRASPLQLFLRAHFQGQILNSIERDHDLGRVVRWRFKNDAVLEFRMVPRGINLIAIAADKRVSLKPVQELPPPQEPKASQPRDLRELFDSWRADRFSPKSAKSPKAKLEKKLEGLRRSLQKVSDEIQHKDDSPWRRLGNWLVEQQSLDVPPEFAALVDRRRKLAWNIEQCFQKAKEVERKLEGTRAREVQLKTELRGLEERLVKGDWLPEAVNRPGGKMSLPPSRTLHLNEQHHVVVGKSAADNMGLLRRAHAWDMWLHVKDRPSAHAILFRPKGGKLSDEMLMKAAQWLVKMSLGSKFREHIGEKFEIVMAECRYVSSIKGDRLGRVNYRHERVLRLRFEGT